MSTEDIIEGEIKTPKSQASRSSPKSQASLSSRASRSSPKLQSSTPNSLLKNSLIEQIYELDDLIGSIKLNDLIDLSIDKIQNNLELSKEKTTYLNDLIVTIDNLLLLLLPDKLSLIDSIITNSLFKDIDEDTQIKAKLLKRKINRLIRQDEYRIKIIKLRESIIIILNKLVEMYTEKIKTKINDVQTLKDKIKDFQTLKDTEIKDIMALVEDTDINIVKRHLQEEVYNRALNQRTNIYRNLISIKKGGSRQKPLIKKKQRRLKKYIYK